MRKSKPVSGPRSFFVLVTGSSLPPTSMGAAGSGHGPPRTLQGRGSWLPAATLDVTRLSTGDLSPSLCLILGKEAETAEKR